MFETNLRDLIKGLRKADDTVAFVSKAMAEIKEELKSRDIETKANALQKLTYVSWNGAV